MYDQLIFNKDVKNSQWGRIVFKTNDLNKIGYPMQMDEFGPLLHSIQKD